MAQLDEKTQKLLDRETDKAAKAATKSALAAVKTVKDRYADAERDVKKTVNIVLKGVTDEIKIG